MVGFFHSRGRGRLLEDGAGRGSALAGRRARPRRREPALAFGGSGVYEFEGFGWHRIRLYDDSGAETTRPVGQPFFRAGRFLVLDRTDPSRNRLLRLEGDTWKSFVELGAIDAFAMGATRLYFVRGGFDVFCRSAVCNDPYAEGIRMFSVALGDGSIREEAKLPACTGDLFAAGDVLYLKARWAGCGGPSARTRLSTVSAYGDGSIPLYSGWTATIGRSCPSSRSRTTGCSRPITIFGRLLRFPRSTNRSGG